MPRPVIDYAGSFHLGVPPAAVWRALERVDRFEAWWPWLSELTLDGTWLRPGAVLRGVVSPPVPYHMRVEVELGSCLRPRTIDAVVRGDLQGTARLRLRREASGTRADVGWSVEMMQRPMRLASRVAHPLLRWGHDRVVAVTVSGFRRNIEHDAAAR
jgi:carbon monoxide dehydrogenase subunit G